MYLIPSPTPIHTRQSLKDGLSGKAPQPGLGSGSSPPNVFPSNVSNIATFTQYSSTSPAAVAHPKFQGIPPNAMSQCILDLMGVYSPKIPLAVIEKRDKSQLWEDFFLENVENGAFYFAIPFVAPHFAKGINALIKRRGDSKPTEKLSVEQIGSSWKALGKEAQQASRTLLGAKMGTLMAVLSFAAGYEYMIQHVKNVITAKSFGIKNFAAVAGLEAGSNQASTGEMDPVGKAKRRGWQVAGLMGSGFALAAAMPWIVKNSKTLTNLSKKILTYINFSSGKGNHFDITKPLLAILAGVGAVSYIDAARDNLERKETGTRLAFVIPYMLFGKELAGNLLASLLQNTKLDIGDDHKTEYKKIKDILKEYKDQNGRALSFLEQDHIWNPKVLFKKFISKDSPMNVGMFRDSLGAELEKIGPNQMSGKVKEAIANRLFLITIGSYVLSALACGLGINWLAYRQTKERYKNQQLQRLQAEASQLNRPPALPTPNTRFGYGSKPLSANWSG